MGTPFCVLIMPCAARPCMATCDADAPRQASGAMVTVAHVLPARPGARPVRGTAVPGVSPPCPVAGVALAEAPRLHLFA